MLILQVGLSLVPRISVHTQVTRIEVDLSLINLASSGYLIDMDA